MKLDLYCWVGFIWIFHPYTQKSDPSFQDFIINSSSETVLQCTVDRTLSSDSFESDPQCFILNYRWPLTLNQKLLVMTVQLSCQAFFRIHIFWYTLYFTRNHILILWLVNMKTPSLIRVAQLVISTFGNVVNKTTPFVLLAHRPYSKTLTNSFNIFCFCHQSLIEFHYPVSLSHYITPCTTPSGPSKSLVISSIYKLVNNTTPWNCIESEKHFLIYCTEYDSLSQKLYFHISENDVNFTNLRDCDRTLYLLRLDNDSTSVIAKYAHVMFQKQK